MSCIPTSLLLLRSVPEIYQQLVAFRQGIPGEQQKLLPMLLSDAHAPAEPMQRCMDAFGALMLAPCSCVASLLHIGGQGSDASRDQLHVDSALGSCHI